MFCRQRDARTLYAVKGEDALDRYMFISTLACTVIGVVLAIVLVVGFLMFLGQGAVVIILAVAVILCCIVLPIVMSTTRLFLSMPNRENAEAKDENDDEEDDQAIYQVWLVFTISKPKEWYCWFRFILDVCALFLCPMITICVSQLPKNGCLFLVLGIFSGLRVYFDAR